MSLRPVDEQMLSDLIELALCDAAQVSGSVRLAYLDAESLEIGIWLGKSARARGIGSAALSLVLDEARRLGACRVLARTTLSNHGARAILVAHGATESVSGEQVTAELALS